MTALQDQEVINRVNLSVTVTERGFLTGGVPSKAVGGSSDAAVPAGEPHRHSTHAHQETEGHHPQQQVRPTQSLYAV